jgi:hypothetical protein
MSGGTQEMKDILERKTKCVFPENYLKGKIK